jgi:hypothetical protein
MSRTTVNVHHSDWVQLLPALLYAYHNTVRSATGYTPHQLLFGWTPRDKRAPLFAHGQHDIHHDVAAWHRKTQFKSAHAWNVHALL